MPSVRWRARRRRAEDSRSAQVFPDWVDDGDCADLEAAAGDLAPPKIGAPGVLAPVLPKLRRADLPWDDARPDAAQNRLISRALLLVKKQRGVALAPGPWNEPVAYAEIEEAGDGFDRCDGVCLRYIYQRGARVATLRAYCGAADAGGEVAFPVAGLKVRPPKHAALLIIYKGKDPTWTTATPRRLRGVRGADVVATTFVREAVSANEPWASFAAKGIN
ncbi:procollagen-proline 4-dioxygenase [Aureococcus anophagefferens]|nr:procollagen-proline 4-dioxygenase [Aureococcus anophagefferens]